MSQPLLTYAQRFRFAVTDAGMRKAIGAAMTALPVTPDRPRRFGAFAWPCDADNIQELDAKNMGIADANGGLTGIENLTGLQKLWLDGNPGIHALRCLSNPSPLPLIELHLNGCPQINYCGTPIRRLHCLEVLDMTGCLGRDFAPFNSLNETLYDPYCDVYLDKLEKLYLSGCENLSTCGINVLAYLPGLEYVDLSNCSGIDSLDCLIGNPNFGDDGGSEDTIDITGLSFTGLDDDIDCLCAKGVKVKNGSTANVCTGGETCETHVTSCRSACPDHRFHTTCTGGEMEDCSAPEGEYVCDVETVCD